MFSISKLSSLTYFCQEVNLPSVSIGEFEQATPFAMIPTAGDRLEYQTLNVQFLVDSEMNNYMGIFNWLNGLGFPESYSQHSNFLESTSNNAISEANKEYSDASLQILGNTNRSVKIVKFVDVFPISLESLIFNSTNSDVQYLVGNATFRYTYYTIE